LAVFPIIVAIAASLFIVADTVSDDVIARKFRVSRPC
jgi:hypothetical protein